MLDFNLDYITKIQNNSQKMKSLKGFQYQNIEIFTSLTSCIFKRDKIKWQSEGFTKILITKQMKPQKFIFINNIALRSIEYSFMQVKRIAIKRSSQNIITSSNLYSFPIAILGKVVESNRLKKLQGGWNSILKSLYNNRYAENRLQYFQEFQTGFLNRLKTNILGFLAKGVIKRIQNEGNFPNFQKIFQNLRVKQLFFGFTQLCVKTDLKQISQSEKLKVIKRDDFTKSNSKRIQIVNEFKRKITNLKGQVNEQTLRNTKKRADGSRQNGLKLMKKNQEMRNLQVSLAQVVSDIERLQKESIRKQSFIDNRPKSTVPFDYLRSLYNEVNQKQNNISKSQIDNKISKSHLIQLLKKPVYLINFSTKLKYLIWQYQVGDSSKKSDLYVNLDNENTCLKNILGSLMRMLFFEPRRQSISQSLSQINNNFEDYRLGISQIRAQKLDSKRR